MEAVSEQAQLTFTINNKMYTISTRKVIFIFISDIGADTYARTMFVSVRVWFMVAVINLCAVQIYL